MAGAGCTPLAVTRPSPQVDSSHAVTNTRFEPPTSQLKQPFTPSSICDNEEERPAGISGRVATTGTDLPTQDTQRSFDVTQPYCCPRCNSMDTKFSYYNNHNKHQPRYYCRGCQRHWTLGGHVRHSMRAPKTKRRKTEPLPSSDTDTAIMLDQLRLLASSTSREQRVLAAQIVCAGVFLRLADGTEGDAFLDAMPMDMIAPAIQANLPNLQASLATVTTPTPPVPDATAALMAATALAQPGALGFPPAAALMQSQLQSQLHWLMQCSGYGTWQLGGEQLAMVAPVTVTPATMPAVPPWASLWAGIPPMVPGLPTGVPSPSNDGGPMTARSSHAL